MHSGHLSTNLWVMFALVHSLSYGPKLASLPANFGFVLHIFSPPKSPSFTGLQAYIMRFPVPNCELCFPSSVVHHMLTEVYPTGHHPPGPPFSGAFHQALNLSHVYVCSCLLPIICWPKFGPSPNIFLFFLVFGTHKVRDYHRSSKPMTQAGKGLTGMGRGR